ncbi:hypothetical protein DNH61_13585 [Paenibacillus sambharensis]|uniref:Small peptidoglycan-associated lipoprotein n=1 Tax=Paenibacillus sambharensis TaxID=1803190 RepID=A0A2W1LKY2_9BACL|nr:hypothetical protein [Paenibacillus sambharensis]PZD95555.1 hypothetical protein DNH61_13585 [Paenibacillus sambharensis]
MRIMKAFILTALLVVIGCTNTSKEDVMKYLSSDSSDTYRIHLFYEEATDLDQQLLVYWNSNPKLLEIIQGIQLYDISTEKNNQMADVLELEDFPCLIVTSDEDVVLKTNDLADIKEFFTALVL